MDHFRIQIAKEYYIVAKLKKTINNTDTLRLYLDGGKFSRV